MMCSEGAVSLRLPPSIPEKNPCVVDVRASAQMSQEGKRRGPKRMDVQTFIFRYTVFTAPASLRVPLSIFLGGLVLYSLMLIILPIHCSLIGNRNLKTLV